MTETELKKIMEETIPFNRHMGVEVVHFEEGKVVLLLPYRDAWIGDPRRPALHGGVISFMIDNAGGAAAFSTLEPSDRLSTVDMRVDYLRPGEPRDLNVRAEVIRGGNRVIVSAMTAYHESPDEPVAEGRAVYNLRRAGARSLMDPP